MLFYGSSDFKLLRFYRLISARYTPNLWNSYNVMIVYVCHNCPYNQCFTLNSIEKCLDVDDVVLALLIVALNCCRWRLGFETRNAELICRSYGSCEAKSLIFKQFQNADILKTHKNRQNFKQLVEFSVFLTPNTKFFAKSIWT